MALATTITTATSDTKEAWRKIAADVAVAIQYDNEEWNLADDYVPPNGTPWSAREVIQPLDILEKGGIASIKEGGYEAKPQSKTLVDATITLVMFNGRFNMSKLARYGDKGSQNQVIKNLTLNGLQTIRAMSAHFSDYFYGYSTARLARTSTDATQASGTYTLDQGYDSSITNGTFISQRFKVGDLVALVRSGALVANSAAGEVTAVATTPSITVTWQGSVNSDPNDLVVKSNSMGGTDLNDTDFNRGLVGLLDAATTTTVQGVSGSTYSGWNAATSDTSGGTLTGIRVRKAIDAVLDEGGGKADTIIMTRSLYRSVMQAERSALRVSDPFGMEIDGDIKSKGRRIISTRRVPPGYCFVMDKSAVSRWALLPKPDGSFSWSDGKEYIDQSGFVFAIDMPVQLVWRSRKKLSYLSGLTESA
jgi:hypothetical protein